MKSVFYITGTSSGIGKALAELLLNDKNNLVFGFSRNCTIEAANYHHISADFSNAEDVLKINFEDYVAIEKIVLINNAGAMQEAKHTGNYDDKNIIADFNINLIAPAVFTNKFIKKYKEYPAEKIIVNVSSGAAQKPIDGWSVYCASKAALDMFSLVCAAEQEIEKLPFPFKIFSIAPGIVNTQMQNNIRKADKDNFSRLNDFIGYKENHELQAPEIVAKKYLDIINNPSKHDKTVFSLREV